MQEEEATEEEEEEENLGDGRLALACRPPFPAGCSQTSPRPMRYTCRITPLSQPPTSTHACPPAPTNQHILASFAKLADTHALYACAIRATDVSACRRQHTGCARR